MARVLGTCGIVCSECAAYKATQAGDAAAISEIAVEWSQRYGANIPPASVWCDGCLSTGDRRCSHTHQCAIRACVLNRGLATCADCDDYGCDKLTSFFQFVTDGRTAEESKRPGGG